MGFKSRNPTHDTMSQSDAGRNIAKLGLKRIELDRALEAVEDEPLRKCDEDPD